MNNLHGMPSLLGGLLSVLLSAIATESTYEQFNQMEGDLTKSSLREIFPQDDKDVWGETGWSPGKQVTSYKDCHYFTEIFAGRPSVCCHAGHPLFRCSWRPGDWGHTQAGGEDAGRY